MGKELNDEILPVGKLPADILLKLLSHNPIRDPQVVLGPGIGLDCAVIDMGEQLIVMKSDPITFATNEIGWYAVQVNANDIATTGAKPRWMLVTLLMPEGLATGAMAETIFSQVHQACNAIGVAVVGGHTEITYGLNRPILVGTLLGVVDREHLVTPKGTQVGDRVLLTKGVPIEATALLARERPDILEGILTQAEISQAQSYLTWPGISVLRDAQIATQAGRVTAMHDPTEGGLANALWELSEASGTAILFKPEAVPISDLSARICQAFAIDPFGSIASGALLLTAPPEDAVKIQTDLRRNAIECAEIGQVVAGEAGVWVETAQGRDRLKRHTRDEIARWFEA